MQDQEDGFFRLSPEDPKDTADGVEKWLKCKQQPEIEEVEISRRELGHTSLGRMEKGGYRDSRDYKLDDLGVTLRVSQTSYGGTFVNIKPSDHMDVYVLETDPKYKSSEWKRAPENPEQSLMASSYYPKLPSPGEGWSQDKIQAAHSHKAIIKVVDKQTGQEHDYKIEARFAGQPDNMVVKSTISEITLAGGPKIPSMGI